MLNYVRCNEPLLSIRTARRTNGGTDIWIRRNIKGPLTDESEEGLSHAYYEAEEAFLRTDKAIGTADVEADFDGYWALAVAYNPYAPIPTDKERIAQLETQNAMLTEYLTALSDGVYGE